MSNRWIIGGLAWATISCATDRRAGESLAAAPSPSIVRAPGFEAPAASTAVIEEPVDAGPSRPTEHFTLLDSQERPIEVYPPFATTGRSPILVLLHATCMQPASVCDWFGSAGRDSGWLVCPSGNSTCAGEPDWSGPPKEKAAFLARALMQVGDAITPFVDERPGVLIGWSRGAFAARDILDAALADPSLASLATRFHGLVLLAAQVTPSVAKLRAAGITRVVMAAGDYDGSRPTMTAAVDALRAGGMEARYVSLGKIAHVWPEDFETRMRAPIAWAAGDAP